MKKTRTSSKGRKCKHPGCQHILSIYNHEALCHVHSGEGWPSRSSGMSAHALESRK